MNPVFEVTENGISAPSYEQILTYLQGEARRIFGEDINLDADTQDGQLIAIFAAAINDVNAQAIATYNSFSPLTAKGIALDNTVAVNGVKRQQATASQVDLRIVGQAGTTIINGVATDNFENRWLLPAQVVIPVSGEITVTATAEEAGAIEATPGSITKIGTPTLGWQSVTNPSSATVGVAVETDNQLRERQTKSTALPSVSLWEGIISSLLNIEGVTRVSGVKNDSNLPDENGIPGHTIAMIVDGGQVEEIGKTIFLKKCEGTGTFGSVETTYIDTYGFPNRVWFSRPVVVPVYVTLTISPAPDYVSSVADELKERIVNYVNSLPIGTSVNIGRVLAAAISSCPTVDTRFDVISITMGTSSGSQSAASIPIKWNEAALSAIENIVVTVSE